MSDTFRLNGIGKDASQLGTERSWTNLDEDVETILFNRDRRRSDDGPLADHGFHENGHRLLSKKNNSNDPYKPKLAEPTGTKDRPQSSGVTQRRHSVTAEQSSTSTTSSRTDTPNMDDSFDSERCSSRVLRPKSSKGRSRGQSSTSNRDVQYGRGSVLSNEDQAIGSDGLSDEDEPLMDVGRPKSSKAMIRRPSLAESFDETMTNYPMTNRERSATQGVGDNRANPKLDRPKSSWKSGNARSRNPKFTDVIDLNSIDNELDFEIATFHLTADEASELKQGKPFNSGHDADEPSHTTTAHNLKSSTSDLANRITTSRAWPAEGASRAWPAEGTLRPGPAEGISNPADDFFNAGRSTSFTSRSDETHKNISETNFKRLSMSGFELENVRERVLKKYNSGRVIEEDTMSRDGQNLPAKLEPLQLHQTQTHVKPNTEKLPQTAISTKFGNKSKEKIKPITQRSTKAQDHGVKGTNKKSKLRPLLGRRGKELIEGMKKSDKGKTNLSLMTRNPQTSREKKSQQTNNNNNNSILSPRKPETQRSKPFPRGDVTQRYDKSLSSQKSVQQKLPSYPRPISAHRRSTSLGSSNSDASSERDNEEYDDDIPEELDSADVDTISRTFPDKVSIKTRDRGQSKQ